MGFKSGFVTIVGRTNVGKSTLLNKIIGQKIVITSDKPQTTRQRLKGVYTNDEGQIIFIDTPGIHKPKYKLGEFLIEETKTALPDADVVLFLVDGSVEAGTGDKWIVENLLKKSQKIIMVVNKVDLIKDMKKRDAIVETYQTMFPEKVDAIKVSAKTGRNIDTLIKNIFKNFNDGPKYYNDDEITDQNLRLITQEIIREKVLLLTQDEIPHSCAIVINKFEETPKIVKIKATIHVEHDSQKGIVIGKNGAMLKNIGSQAREEIEELVENKVFLELFVKVSKNWRKNQNLLKDFGYFQEKE